MRLRRKLADVLSSERYDVVASPGLVEGKPVLSVCEARRVAHGGGLDSMEAELRPVNPSRATALS